MTDREKNARRLTSDHGLGATQVPNPDGPVRPDDAGGLKGGLGIEGNQIVLDFGRHVAWVSMTESEARSLAQALIHFADKLFRRSNGLT